MEPAAAAEERPVRRSAASPAAEAAASRDAEAAEEPRAAPSAEAPQGAPSEAARPVAEASQEAQRVSLPQPAALELAWELQPLRASRRASQPALRFSCEPLLRQACVSQQTYVPTTLYGQRYGAPVSAWRFFFVRTPWLPFSVCGMPLRASISWAFLTWLLSP
jgi:hypothetical protein